MTPERSVGGCTVATRNYLADARLAARSFVDHHPGARFTILVVDGDRAPPATWTHRAVELVTPSELGLPTDELHTMAAIYDPAELACALKPLALRRVLDRADDAVYVDGDVEILAPMDELVAAAGDHDVVLVPHVLDPLPRDGRFPDEPGLLGAGMYNGGLIACRTGSGAFLDWWQERLRRDCLNRPDLMLHGDQRWLDFVPVLFDHHILRDPTYDVAYWNLHERPTAWVEGRLCVVDRPVRCFHYSGLTDARPWELSRFAGERPRLHLADLPAVARQCRGWLTRRRAVDAEGDRALGYRFARTERGVVLDHRSRMLTRDALLAAEADPTGRTPRPPLPHADDGGRAWEEWLDRSAEGGRVGRYLLQVWRESPELIRRFPEVPGADEPGLLRWVAGFDADGADIPDVLRPDPQEADVAAPEPIRPLRRPPRPDASAQQPVASIEVARAAHDRGPQGPPGAAGKVVGRLLAGRDRQAEETANALTEAVAELAERLADLSARVDRTNDSVFTVEGRTDEVAADLANRARSGSETDANLGRRLVEVESSLADARSELDGALDQDRITAGIVADAETRLADELDDLRLRIAKLAAQADQLDPATPADQHSPAPPPAEETAAVDAADAEEDAR